MSTNLKASDNRPFETLTVREFLDFPHQPISVRDAVARGVLKAFIRDAPNGTELAQLDAHECAKIEQCGYLMLRSYYCEEDKHGNRREIIVLVFGACPVALLRWTSHEGFELADSRARELDIIDPQALANVLGYLFELQKEKLMQQMKEELRGFARQPALGLNSPIFPDALFDIGGVDVTEHFEKLTGHPLAHPRDGRYALFPCDLRRDDVIPAFESDREKAQLVWVNRAYLDAGCRPAALLRRGSSVMEFKRMLSAVEIASEPGLADLRCTDSPMVLAVYEMRRDRLDPDEIPVRI